MTCAPRRPPYSRINLLVFPKSQSKGKNNIPNQCDCNFSFSPTLCIHPLPRYALGRPKGVLHTQRQVMTNAARAVDACKLTSNDVWFHAAPMFHAMGKG